MRNALFHGEFNAISSASGTWSVSGCRICPNNCGFFKYDDKVRKSGFWGLLFYGMDICEATKGLKYEKEPFALIFSARKGSNKCF
jgi:hypothetical protein